MVVCCYDSKSERRLEVLPHPPPPHPALPLHWTLFSLFHLVSLLKLSWPLCSVHNSIYMSSSSLDTAELNVLRLQSHVHTPWIFKPTGVAWMREAQRIINQAWLDLNHRWTLPCMVFSIHICVSECVVEGFQRHAWCRISGVTCKFTCSSAFSDVGVDQVEVQGWTGRRGKESNKVADRKKRQLSEKKGTEKSATIPQITSFMLFQWLFCFMFENNSEVNSPKLCWKWLWEYREEHACCVDRLFVCV